MSRPDDFQAYTVVLLAHAHEYLLLRSAKSKRFAPGLWTGVGGRVESDEFSSLSDSALRELVEETGIRPEQVQDFALRRVLLLTRAEQLIMVLYFTGSLEQRLLPPCTEGELAWLPADHLPERDIIPSTRPVLPLLIADQIRDPSGSERIQLGVGHYRPDGTFEEIAWS